jgi:YidC/Oxa1 family membrane protein insertase
LPTRQPQQGKTRCARITPSKGALIFALCCCWLCCTPSPAAAETFGETVAVTTDQLRITFSRLGARPVRWQACHPDCRSDGPLSKRMTFGDLSDGPSARLLLGDDPQGSARLNRLPYRVKQQNTDDALILQFNSEPVHPGVFIEKVYTVSKTNYQVKLSLRIHGDGADHFLAKNRPALGVAIGKSFIPAPAPGFAGAYERVQTIYFDDLEFQELDPQQSTPLAAGAWSGIRNRFWALLVRQAQPGALSWASDTTQRLAAIALAPQSASSARQEYEFYAGPIEYDALKATDGKLTGILFASLWDWLRALCFGLMFLLARLYQLIGNYGIAIVGLALSVKLLMLPLNKIADKFQQDVDEKRSRIQPFIDQIKDDHKGEEQVLRIHKLHKEHGVHPLYTLKSLFGFLILFPIFIAVFDMLAENFALSEVSFLWIEDLAKPDRLMELPWEMPFFGSHLNLLPFLMTSVTFLASFMFHSQTLSLELQHRQRRNLYLMAILFFVLFYTFPAGMVLYWTSTNLIQFLKDQLGRLVTKSTAPSG